MEAFSAASISGRKTIMAEEQKHQHHKMDEDEEPVVKNRSTKKTKCTIKSFAKNTELCTLCFGLQQRGHNLGIALCASQISRFQMVAKTIAKKHCET